MRRTIICICGPSNAGKTSVIVEVSKVLSQSGGSSSQVIYRSSKDICVTIVYNGHKIGLASQGDPNSLQGKWLNYLVQEGGCDIIVCASRSKGSTVTTVKNCATKNNYDLILLHKLYAKIGRGKYHSSLYDNLNNAMVNTVVCLINQLPSLQKP